MDTDPDIEIFETCMDIGGTWIYPHADHLGIYIYIDVYVYVNIYIYTHKVMICIL